MNISPISTEKPKDSRGATETAAYEILTRLKIPFCRVDNDAVEAMEECVEISNALGAEIRKTIFVCDAKKKNFYLVILPAEKHFDTKKFREKTGSRVSFASPEYMQKILGTVPGSASVMSLLNDKDNSVKLVIDQEVADEEWFACNPGANTSHIKIKTRQLLDIFLPEIKHEAAVLSL